MQGNKLEKSQSSSTKWQSLREATHDHEENEASFCNCAWL